MAVIQISKIQVRRGLEENLPQLASGEFGWSIDTQKLYIGNGTLSEGAPEIGNTEIVTASTDIISAIESYVFKGQESGYTSRTGASATTPVYRTLQNKLDEQISARDFGALGDGSTDDTLALQRAIDQVFPKTYYTTVGVRRKLHIPAGTYIISDLLTVPPYAHIEGDGPLSTIIKQTDSVADAVIKVRDSKEQLDGDMGTSAADLPFQIYINNLTLENNEDNHCAVIDSSEDITFSRVRFKGVITSPLTSGADKAGVYIIDTVGPTENVLLDQCEFANISYGVRLVGDIGSVTVNQSTFDNLYQGVNVQANVSSPRSLRITNSVFNTIAAEAVKTEDETLVISAFNLYRSNIGYGNVSVMVSTVPTSSVINYHTGNGYSIADYFERTVAHQSYYPTVYVDPLGVHTEKVSTINGTVSDTPGYVEFVANNASTVTNTSFILTSLTSSAIVDYKIVRDTSYRIGTIKVSHYNGTVVFDDEYSENSATGITLTFTGNVSANTAVLGYTSTDTGIDGTIKYTLRTFV